MGDHNKFCSRIFAVRMAPAIRRLNTHFSFAWTEIIQLIYALSSQVGYNVAVLVGGSER